jgi:OmpA-OmpF porin, OOP family
MPSAIRRPSLLRPTLALLILGVAPVAAQTTTVDAPPAELSFLTTFLKLRKTILFNLWSDVNFPSSHEVGVTRRGKNWQLIGEVPGVKDVEPAWSLVKATFIKNGWVSVKSYRAGGFLEVMSYNHNGVEAWANFDLGGMPMTLVLDVVEVAPAPFTITLAAPATLPETMAPDKGDFPYLTPLPGSRFHSGGTDTGPFRVTPSGSNETELVANGTIERNYDLPGLSNLSFVTAYHDALTKAGWSIIAETKQSITAHYAARGRNIWTYMILGGDGYTIRVGDAGGTGQLGTSLARTCHVALYGVFFDFNKATLQPASDGALAQVAGILAADKALKLEVQGHTDNVGTDAYNQTLSEARAKSVMAWLVQHGVAADRLTAKGYGKTKPVADNANDEGRAKNRRVEIADPRCTPKVN